MLEQPEGGRPSMDDAILPGAGPFLPPDFSERERVLMTASCRDCDVIPKVKDAGTLNLQFSLPRQAVFLLERE